MHIFIYRSFRCKVRKYYTIVKAAHQFLPVFICNWNQLSLNPVMMVVFIFINITQTQMLEWYQDAY